MGVGHEGPHLEPAAEGARLNDDANRAAWVANVGLGAGLLTVGVATVLFLVSSPKTPPATMLLGAF